MAVNPISPNEVQEKKVEIPDGVIEVFNDFIAKNFSNGRAEILEKKLLSAIAIKMRVSKDACISNGWLDVEEIFQSAGWDVKRDKPVFIDVMAMGNLMPSNRQIKEAMFIFIKKGN